MSKWIQSYFDLFNFNDGPASPQRFKDVFTEKALFQYGGERVLGMKALVEYHQDLMSGWTSSAITWAVISEGGDSLTAEWSQTYTGTDDQPGVRSGKVIAHFTLGGLIAELYTFLEHDTRDEGRVLLGKHLDVWWVRDDSDERLELMKGIYADGITFVDPAAPAQGHAELNAHIPKTPVLADSRIGQYFATFDHLLYRWETHSEDGTYVAGWEYLHFQGQLIDNIAVFTDIDFSAIA
ncbi:hypothetical protein [Streptomyces flaveolus]|uniref:SnoaL-like domain-containing protein n=1 Tax=Streptomyces flaveolus TaxID=67297 RepID=A0ABV3AQU4_9ACTN